MHRLFTGQAHLNNRSQASGVRHVLLEQPDLQLDFTGIESVTPEFAAELCQAIVQVRGPDGLRSALLLQTMAFPVLAAFVPAMQAAAAAPVMEQHDSPADNASRSSAQPPCGTYHDAPSTFNPFAGLEAVQQQYLRYVHTFQTFRNPQISAWVGERVNQGTLLWRDPTVQLGRFYRKGLTFDALERRGLHSATRHCFTVTRFSLSRSARIST